MSIAEMQTATISGSHGGRPSDEELDLFGITHEGKVRPDNQDHFLLCTIHPQIVIHGTSLPDPDSLPLRGSRLGTMMLVADGVGGAADGSEAARLASEAVMRYVASSMRCYHTAGSSMDEEFLDSLRSAAMQAHDAVRAEAATRTDQRRMATTLTLGIGVWPWLYVVQVGDSRCYVYSGKKLKQVTRDQTVGQQLVDEGAMGAEQLVRSPLKNVLSSAIGADEATPVVARVDVRERGCVVLLCSDGLTKHVTDDEIAAHFAKMQSAEQVSRDLLQLALDRGGSDNITLIVVRAPLKERKSAA
jgi:serine/threonine protein phosphatase PrpC